LMRLRAQERRVNGGVSRLPAPVSAWSLDRALTPPGKTPSAAR